MAIVKYIKGSVLDAPQKYIGHCVNAQNVMGGGVAKVLYKKYPEVKKVYHEQTEWHLYMAKQHSVDLLGDYHTIVTLDGKKIFNIYTQEYYGYREKKYVSYDAIYDAFVCIAESYGQNGESIAIPKIGCGLAGGNWDVVSRIIDDATGDDLDVYVYYLEDE